MVDITEGTTAGHRQAVAGGMRLGGAGVGVEVGAVHRGVDISADRDTL